jgi:hypothetical protein
MHSTGMFIDDGRPFSEKVWGARTAIYVKLAQEMSAPQWGKLYGMLRVNEEMLEELKEHSKPIEHWTDDPEEYFIVGSDPTDESS